MQKHLHKIINREIKIEQLGLQFNHLIEHKSNQQQKLNQKLLLLELLKIYKLNN